MPGANASEPLCVYCAGPLFNQAERDEMTAIANVLCDAGYEVFLPHRDGMEFRLVHRVLTDRGLPPAGAAELLHVAIFSLDVFQVAAACDCLVWNLNGRVPDEGAVSEAAIAWTLGKPLVAFSDDVRSLIAGRPNPLLSGLVDFETVRQIEDIPAALDEAVRRLAEFPTPRIAAANLRRTVDNGAALWAAMNEQGSGRDDESLADAVMELFAPAAMS